MKYTALLGASLLLAACDSQPTRVVYVDAQGNEVATPAQTTTTVYQPAPTTVVHEHSSNDGFVSGMVVGSLLSSSGSRGGGGYDRGYSKKTKKQTTVINNHYNTTTTYKAPKAAKAPAYQPSRIRSSSPMASRATRNRKR